MRTSRLAWQWGALAVGVMLLSVGVFALFPNNGDAAVGDNMTGYAWSDNIGWINFNSGSYGVRVDASGLMSGYAWSDNIGWITFNSNQLSGCATAPCEARFNKVTGIVTGWARVCSGMSDTPSNPLYPNQTNPNNTCGGVSRTDGWDGWIQLRGAAGNYGITVTGCNWDGWAWGGNVVGWIHFRGPTANYAVVGTDVNSCQQAGIPSLTVSPATATILVNGTQVYTPSFDPDGPTGPQAAFTPTSGVTWATSNTSIATITGISLGTATGRASGIVTVTATYDPDGAGAQTPITSAPVSLTVTAAPSSATFSIAPAFSSIFVGDTQQFTATFDQDGAGTAFAPQTVTTGVTWFSSATSTASISGTGLATGNIVGNVTVSAHHLGLSATAWLAVQARPVATLTISPAIASIAVGGSQQYSATYFDGTTITVIHSGSPTTVKSATTWGSSNTAVANMTPTNFGLAMGVSASAVPVTISVTYAGLTATGQLTVTSVPPTTPTLTVTPDNASILVGGTQQYTATYRNSSGVLSDVTSSAAWSSLNTGIATMNTTGRATGVAPGTATIRASYASISDTASLTVSSPPIEDDCEITLEDADGNPIPDPLKFTVPLISNRLIYVSGDGITVSNLALDSATTPGLEISARDSTAGTLTLHATSPTVIGRFTGTIRSTGPVCTSATFNYEIAEQGDPGEI